MKSRVKGVQFSSARDALPETSVQRDSPLISQPAIISPGFASITKQKSTTALSPPSKRVFNPANGAPYEM
jgi:hypothetical protein